MEHLIDDDHQPGPSGQIESGNGSVNDEKNRIDELLKAFIVFFYKRFEKVLKESRKEAEPGGKPKSGKMTNLLAQPLGAAFGASVGFASPLGIPVGANLGGKCSETACSAVSGRSHREKAKSISEVFWRIDNKYLCGILVEAGGEIFQSFESQFIAVTDVNGYLARGMKKLALDAVNRAINYMIECKNEISNINRQEFVDLITKGVIFGKSKEGILRKPLRYIPLIRSISKPGYSIRYKNNKCKTSELFEKVGIKTMKSDKFGNKYYRKKSGSSDSTSYGYRLCFAWEKENELNLADKLIHEYVYEKPPRTEHQYILEENKLKEKLNDILKGLTPIGLVEVVEEQNKTQERLHDVVQILHSFKSEEAQTEDIIFKLEISKYYIPRTFNRNTEIKRNFEEEKSKFYVTRSRQFDNFKEDLDIVLISNTRKDFEILCNKYKKCNIHWLQEIESKVLWQESYGSMSNLRSFIDIDQEPEKTDINSVTNIKDEVVVISSEPGMGKSTILSHLAEEQFSFFKIIIVNLNDYTGSLSEAKIGSKGESIAFLQKIKKEEIDRDFDHLILFFDGFDEIASNTDYKDKVLNLVFYLQNVVKKLWITTRPYAQYDLEDKLSVISYTLEPLSRTTQKEFLVKFWKTNLIFNVVKGLINKIEHVISHEDALQLADKVSKFINLENIELKDNDDNLNIIKNVPISNVRKFTKNINDLVDKQLGNKHKVSKTVVDIIEKVYNVSDVQGVKNLIQVRGKSYAENLIAEFSDSVTDKEGEFMGVPLQIRMLAEAFQEEFYEDFKIFYFLEPDQHNLHESKLPKRLNLLHLYERFMENKHKIYYVDKGFKTIDLTNVYIESQYNTSRKCFIKQHRLLAVNLLFSEQEFLSNEEKNTIIELKEKIKTGQENSGIVYKIIDDKPCFIHRTFAEYFAADFFVSLILEKLLKKTNDNAKYEIMCNFLRNNIFKEENKVVRYFFDHILVKDKVDEIHYAVLNNDIQRVEDLLKQDKNIINKEDEAGRTPLHLAAAYDYAEIVDVLLMYKPDMNIKDHLFSWSPLAYYMKSVFYFRDTMARKLLDKEANGSDVFQAIEIKNNERNGQGLLYIAVQNKYIKFIEGFLMNVKEEISNEELLKFVNAKDYYNKYKQRGYTPFQWAVEGGNTKVIESFLNTIKDKFTYNELLKFVSFVDEMSLHMYHHYKMLNVFGVHEHHSTYKPLCMAIGMGQQEIIKIVLNCIKEKSPENFLNFINATDYGCYQDCSLLEIAVEYNNIEAIEYLVYMGAKVNAEDIEGIVSHITGCQ